MDWGGFQAQDNIQQIINVFYKNNYTVVSFDATNSIGESGGKYEDATLGKHYEDLVDVINWSKKQEWFIKNFILAGHSMGGYAVLRYAEEFPDEVKAVFPYAPVISGELSIEAHKKFESEKFKIWEETGWQTRISKSKPGLEKKLPFSHIVERLKHDLRLKTENLNMPVFIIVGEKDESCPPNHQKIFYDLIPKDTKKELYIVKGAPHTIRETEQVRELLNSLDSWLKKL